MEDVRKEDEVVLEEETDELDSWFGDEEEIEDDEDLSAEEEVEDEEDSSPSETEEEPEPDDEDQTEDAEPTASEDGTSTKSKSEDDPYAWMGELDSDLKDKVERLVQSDRSNRGRVAALQRQLDSVRAEQEARERTQSAAAARAVAGGKPIEEMDDEELAEFMEEFPSVASNVQKLIDRRVRQELDQRVRPIEQASLQKEIEANRRALREEASIIFNTVETGIDLDDVLSSHAFKQWIGMQPKEYQQFASNANSVPAAAKVLEDFAMYTEEQVAAMVAAEEENVAKQQQQEKSRSADQTAARRNQARQGATPKSKSAQLTTKPGNGGYEDWFDYFAEGGN